jgi:AraC family transcriptional regulator
VEHAIHRPSHFDGTKLKDNLLIMHLSSPVTARVSVDADSHLMRLVPGDLHIIPLGCRIRASFEGPLEMLVLRFDNVFLRTPSHTPNETGQAILRTHLAIRDLQLQSLMSAVHEEMKQGCPTGFSHIHQIGAVLTNYLALRYSTVAPPKTRWQTGLPPFRLRLVLDHIHNNLETMLSLVDLAKLVHLSPQHFANLFRESTGLAPHQYVLRERVQKAKSLLAETSLPIVDVSLAVGFANQSHFTEVFHRLVGVTPKRHRQRYSGFEFKTSA